MSNIHALVDQYHAYCLTMSLLSFYEMNDFVEHMTAKDHAISVKLQPVAVLKYWQVIENNGNAKFAYLTIKRHFDWKTGSINEQVKIFPIVNDTTEDDFSMIIITCSAFS